jgi:predicted membrane chloride channel (bestrophin family)
MYFLAARHTSIFAFVLKAHLRGKQENVTDVVRAMLPPIDADFLLSQRKLPAAVMIKLRQGIQQLTNTGQLTMAEEMALDRSIHKLDESLMTCERICASPIPPLYTSHTSRLLMFYLGFLPLALHQSSLNGLVVFLVSFVVGYTMLGLDEISHLLEQPFRLMPLLQLSKISMRDVADNLVCQPASLKDSLSQLGTDPIFVGKGSLKYQPETPEYW